MLYEVITRIGTELPHVFQERREDDLLDVLLGEAHLLGHRAGQAGRPIRRAPEMGVLERQKSDQT